MPFYAKYPSSSATVTAVVPGSISVTQGTTPWVVQESDKTGSGTITGVSGTVIANTAGSSTVVFSVFANWVGTLVIEALDGNNANPITAYRIDDNSKTPLTSLTSNMSFMINCGGYETIRVRATAWTSGTAGVIWTSSLGLTLPALEGVVGKAGNAAPTNSVQVSGSDGTVQRTLLTSTAGALRIDPTGTTPQPVTQSTSPWVVSGTVTANQGTSPWITSVSNFPAIQPVSQSGTWNVGRTWTLASGTDSITAVQGTSPWVVSGAVTLPYDTNYGSVGATTLRTASQIGNSTGAAAFGAGTTSAQTLRVVLPTDQSSIPVTQSGVWSVSATQGTSPWVVSGTVAATQSGTWTTGRTWTLASGTDSVASVQSGTWTVQPGNTANTTPWLTTINQGGNSATVTASNALKVDGSAVTQPISGTVTANQGTSPWVTSRNWTLSSGTDSVAAVQSGTWNINNISGTISLPTGASTSALQTTGNTSLSSIDGKLNNNYGVATGGLRTASQIGNTTGAADFNYGTIGAQTLRTASQIGNATGAASFGAGTTGAQTLRVVLPTDQTAIPATQSGIWTTGRTWTLSSGTDSVTVAPLTNSSIVKAQLQDNAGTAITLGQKTMASSVPVVLASDQTTITVQGPSGTPGTPSGGILTIQGTTGGSNVNTTARGTNPTGTDTVLPLPGIDATNSTSSNLGVSGTFTGTFKDVSTYSNLTVIVFTDQASATDGLIIEYSSDGTNVDDNDLFTVPANNGQQLSFPLPAKFYRIRYVNGTIAQTAFRLQAKLHAWRSKPSSQRIASPVNSQQDAEVVIAAPARVNLTPSTPGTVSVGVASGAFVSANATRTGLIVQNLSANTVSFHLTGGTAVLNSGITLLPGGTWNMDEFSFTTSAITAIASAAASNCSVQELSY